MKILKLMILFLLCQTSIYANNRCFRFQGYNLKKDPHMEYYPNGVPYRAYFCNDNNTVHTSDGDFKVSGDASFLIFYESGNIKMFGSVKGKSQQTFERGSCDKPLAPYAYPTLNENGYITHLYLDNEDNVKCMTKSGEVITLKTGVAPTTFDDDGYIIAASIKRDFPVLFSLFEDRKISVVGSFELYESGKIKRTCIWEEQCGDAVIPLPRPGGQVQEIELKNWTREFYENGVLKSAYVVQPIEFTLHGNKQAEIDAGSFVRFHNNGSLNIGKLKKPTTLFNIDDKEVTYQIGYIFVNSSGRVWNWRSEI